MYSSGYEKESLMCCIICSSASQPLTLYLNLFRLLFFFNNLYLNIYFNLPLSYSPILHHYQSQLVTTLTYYLAYIFSLHSSLYSRLTPFSYILNLYSRSLPVTYIFNIHLRLITTTNLIISSSSWYPLVPWNADDKRLIKEIFSIFEQNSIIRKGIYPCKEENLEENRKSPTSKF